METTDHVLRRWLLAAQQICKVLFGLALFTVWFVGWCLETAGDIISAGVHFRLNRLTSRPDLLDRLSIGWIRLSYLLRVE